MDQSAGYTFLKWNGEYGDESKFVVRDNDSGKQAMFTPGRTHDIVWTKSNLVEDPEIQGWQEFGQETVDNLEDVCF